MEYGNVFYFDNLNACGGTESVFYYLSKKYCNYDITILYKTGDIKQINRLKKYVRVKQFKGETIKCKKIFFNYSIDIINSIDAEEYNQVIHTDYKASKKIPHVHPKITRYIGVSKVVCNSFEELTGIKCELCYNPLMIDEPKRVLKLLSATRLSHEKGKDRMIKLANILDANNIPYIWFVFTDDTLPINNPNIIYLQPRLDITNVMGIADFVVQLSDDVEGFGLTPAEALSQNIPVIVTDVRAFKEIGVNNDNAIILNLDMSDVPVNEIYTRTFDFKYKPPKDRWDELLAPGDSTYKEESNWKADVKCVRRNGYDDLKLLKHVVYDEELTDLNFHRAEDLENLGYVKITKIKKS